MSRSEGQNQIATGLLCPKRSLFPLVLNTGDDLQIAFGPLVDGEVVDCIRGGVSFAENGMSAATGLDIEVGVFSELPNDLFKATFRSDANFFINPFESPIRQYPAFGTNASGGELVEIFPRVIGTSENRFVVFHIEDHAASLSGETRGFVSFHVLPDILER